MDFENKPKAPVQESSEHTEQDAREKANVEAFCADAIRASQTLKPEVKEYLEAYVRKEVGQWSQYDGKAVVFDGFSRDDTHRQIVAYFLVHELDASGKPMEKMTVEVTDDIPMPEEME